MIRKDPMLDAFRADLRLLNPFSVQFRYPGESATSEDAALALKTMNRIRKFLIAQYSLAE